MTETERSKPTMTRSFLSLPFCANSIFGWLLVACFWMPFGIGCDKKQILYPVSVMQDDSLTDLGDLIFFLFFYWPYFFGAVFGAILIALAVNRPKRIARWLIPVPVVILVFLLLVGLSSPLFSDESAGERFIIALVMSSPPGVVLLWSGSAMRSKEFLLAATRLTCGLSIIMPLTLYGLGFFSFVSRFMYGFYFAVMASIGLTITSWFLYTRGESVFSDENLPQRKVQFRIRTLMVWTLIVAGASAVLQNMQD